MTTVSLSILTLVIGWVGIKYTESELPRASQELLLHNLKEGVIIVDDATSHLQFINRSAYSTCERLSATCNLSLLKLEK